MKTSLNDFILDLFNHKDNRVLEKKLAVWKEELAKEKLLIEELKLKYLQTHENPRKDFELAEADYLQQMATAKERYLYSTDITKKANLYEWLNNFQNIPDILYTKKSSIYTYNN